MLNRPRRTATWYRYVLGAGAVIVLTAVGSAAMWSGWLPSRPLQWNDINGRLNLGNAGAAVRGERPIIVNQWPSAGSLGYQAKAEGLAAGTAAANALKFAERYPRLDDRGDKDKGSARWGASSKGHLADTAGRSNVGGGMGGIGGGLGTGGGVARVPKDPPKVESKAAKAPTPAKPSSASSGSRSGGGAAAAPVPATTVGQLASTAPGIVASEVAPALGDAGSGIGGVGSVGGSSGLAATPEPASIVLIGTGAFAAALFRRRRK
jgi:PEP-CTERM motif-containing protein